MDANNFMNSASNGSMPCSNCGKLIATASKFCVYCGTKVNQPSFTQAENTAFSPIAETPASTAPAFAPAAETPVATAPAFAPAAETPAATAPAFAPAAETPATAPAFAPAAETPATAPAFAPAAETPATAPAFAPAAETPATAPAFAPAAETPATAPAFAPADKVAKKQAKKFEEPAEPVSAFALGLPDWDLVPPNILVVRRR